MLSARSRWLSQRVVQAVLLGVLHMVNSLMRQSIATLVLFMSDVPYLQPEQVGNSAATASRASLIFAYSQGYLWMQIPAGVLAQRIGCKPTYLSMLILLSVIILLVPSAADGGITTFWLMLFSAGFVLAPITPVSGIVLSKWFPSEERSTGIAIRDAGSFVGTMLSLQLCPILADSAMLGWRNTYYCCGTVFCACAVLYAILAAESPQTSAFISAAELDELTRRVATTDSISIFQQGHGLKLFLFPAVWAVVVAHGIDNFCHRGVHSYHPSYFKMLGVDDVSTGSYLAMAELVAFFGRPIAAACDRAFQKHFLKSLGLARCRKVFSCSGFAMVAASLVLAAHVRSPLLSTVAFSMVNLASAFHTSGYRASYLDQTLAYQGILMGLGNMLATVPATMTGFFVMYVGGVSPTADSFMNVWYMVAAAQIAALFFFLLFASDRTLDEQLMSKKSRKAE